MYNKKEYRVFLDDHNYKCLQDHVAWIKGFEAGGKQVDAGWTVKELIKGLKVVKDK